MKFKPAILAALLTLMFFGGAYLSSSLASKSPRHGPPSTVRRPPNLREFINRERSLCKQKADLIRGGKPLLRFPIITDYRVITPSGGDDTKMLQAWFANLKPGDVGRMEAANGDPRFIITSPLDWTTSGSLPSITGRGVQLYADFALSGTQAMITYGAPLGCRQGGVSWTGCLIMGSMALQNLSYSRFEPDSCDCVILQSENTDNPVSYNYFCYPGGGAGDSGNWSAVVVNQLSPSGCCDMNAWYNTPLGSFGGNGGAVIWQVNPAATGPVGLSFYGCDHEANNLVQFKVGNISFTERDGYWEAGTMSAGTIGSGASIQRVNCAHFPGFDPRYEDQDQNE